MYAPLSKYRYITPVLILLSMGLVVMLILLKAGAPRALCLCWVTAGLLTLGIWHIVSRFKLDGGASVKAFSICWPLLTQVLCFTYCYFSQGSHLGSTLIQQLALLAIISLQMSLWQRHVAIIKHLLLGLIVGLTSTLHPHIILLTLLFPVAGYYMRCLSPRNLLSAISGALLGIWFIYLILILKSGMEAADQMILSYATLFQPEGYGELTQLGLWQYLFLGFVALLLLIHNVTGVAVDVGQSVRAEASIILLSVISFAIVLLFAIDVSHLTTYVDMLALLLSLQLTIHQANSSRPFIEWWILLVQLIGMALCLLPLFVII